MADDSVAQVNVLPQLAREQVLELVSQDVTHVSEDDFLLKLKARVLVEDNPAAFRQQLLARLHPANRSMHGVVEFLAHAKARSARPASPTTSNSFHFDYDDARDLERFRTVGVRFQPHTYAAALQRIRDHCSLRFSDESVARRFDQIMLTLLKGIRKEAEGYSLLVSTPDAGGIGLDPVKAQEVLASVRDEIAVDTASHESDPLITQLIQRANGGYDAAHTTTKDSAMPSYVPSVIRIPEKHLDFQKLRVAPVPAPSGSVAYARNQVSETVRQKTMGGEGPLPMVVDVTLGNPSQAPKALEPILLGPIEEIAHVTLVDLRREKGGVSVFADKLRQNIKRIGQDSFDQQLAAIAAWKRSPLHQMYIAILNQSLAHGIPVVQVIERCQGDVFTPQEFDGIAELNCALSY